MALSLSAVNHFKNQEQNQDDMAVTPDHVLIYEDNEGDRMLVGDVPWEYVFCVYFYFPPYYKCSFLERYIQTALKHTEAYV